MCSFDKCFLLFHLQIFNLFLECIDGICFLVGFLVFLTKNIVARIYKKKSWFASLCQYKTIMERIKPNNRPNQPDLQTLYDMNLNIDRMSRIPLQLCKCVWSFNLKTTNSNWIRNSNPIRTYYIAAGDIYVNVVTEYSANVFLCRM